MKDEARSPVTRSLVPAAAFVIVVAGMKVSASILIPVLLAAFIAVISAPPLFWLKRKGIPTALANDCGRDSVCPGKRDWMPLLTAGSGHVRMV